MHIYTLTINPAIDLFIDTLHYQPNQVNRSQEWHLHANGKGVNVALTLHQLGVSSRAMGFCGGFTGDFLIKTLQENAIDSYFIQGEGLTRINSFVYVHENQSEYKMNNPGPKASEMQRTALIEMIQEHLQPDDIMMISGSYLGVVDRPYMMHLIDLISDKGARLVFDVDDVELFWYAVQHKPYLVKPSEEELIRFFAYPSVEQGDDSLEQASNLLIKNGVEHVVISLGARGAYYAHQDQRLYAPAPQGKVVNTSCAGDAMLATFIAKQAVANLSSVDALAYAVAAGSSTAFVPILSDLHDIESLKSQIHVQSMAKGERL
ncbi:1-phosphofructokinase (plasmid) [Entomospira entomophila]|uniref:1-phosphofructokinase n=1 Tax=Entomospira entomophila TaxID=2719988 RepID=A0A968GBP3_9SPIO|nr:1-phosphofructokinase [Entomospira entomophilus]NIZ41425.1 1-phosphofructokinase [Entomospira entomophilus]WDI36375.1 1-phosphofructokinase [Entomospira entomophilus]